MIGGQLHHYAEISAGKQAVVCGDESLRWKDLALLVDSTAQWLAESTPSGCGIALFLENCAALPVLVLAIARSGRVAQVLDPGWPKPVIEQTVTAISSALMISSKATPELDCSIVLLDPHDSLQSLRKLVAMFPGKFAPCDAPTLPFYIGFTSGSTGRPKGYRRSQQSWIDSFAIEAKEFGQTSDDIIIAPGALSHSLFLYAAIHALHIGATIILCRNFRPAQVLDAIRQHRGTMLYAVPAQLNLLSGQQQKPGSGNLSSLRYIIASGSKWRESDRSSLRELFPAALFAEFYGASELSFVAVAKEDEHVPSGSVGRAFENVIIKISNTHCKLPGPSQPLQTGEIFVSSPMVFETYAGDGDEADINRDNAYISVGDMGYLDASGFLFLTGRKDRMIVTAGKNLFPEEIEAVLQSHPDIREAAIIGLPDEKRGSRIIAVLDTMPGTTTTSADMIAFARRFLPLYKIPRRYFRALNWPRTRSGKTGFRQLKKQFLADFHEQLP